MDERSLKKLVITLLVAIAVIMLAKSMLTKTYTNLNKATAAKKQAVVIPTPVVTPLTPAVEMTAASSVVEIPAESSVSATVH